VNGFWDMIRRRFGYSSEYPTLKKLFLSFIITHIDRNANIALTSYEQYINKQSNECEIFIRGWMDHSKDSETFDHYCHQLLAEDGHKLEKSPAIPVMIINACSKQVTFSYFRKDYM
jgi:hypothetical protein